MDKFIKQHSSGLIILNIPEELNQNTYDFFEKKWMESDSACLNISKFNNLNLLRELFELVLNQPDTSFKNALLNDIVEQDLCPSDILKTVFNLGEVGNCVSICLRNDLNNELITLCDNSKIREVQEHLKHKK